MHGKESVSKKYLHGWVSQNCPRLVMWVHKYITHMLTVGHRTIPDNTNEDEVWFQELLFCCFCHYCHSKGYLLSSSSTPPWSTFCVWIE